MNFSAQDLLNKDQMAYSDVAMAKDAFAFALAYSLKETNLDTIYGCQALGIVGEAYCVITMCCHGTYAQPTPEVILPINVQDVELLRAL